MAPYRLLSFLSVICLIEFLSPVSGQLVPMVISTWAGSRGSTEEAWRLLQEGQMDIMDVLVQGVTVSEMVPGGSIGYGGSPDADGEVTLDAMVMDGRTMKAGSVGCLRRVKNAIGVAQAVLNHTEHTMLVGDLATNFAISMGFPDESLSTAGSNQSYENWKAGNCQPNYWTDVVPDSATSCGPYSPAPPSGRYRRDAGVRAGNDVTDDEPAHDTIGTIVIDAGSNVVSGTSTNGKIRKIPGRVGDSPIIGSGGYAQSGVGAAVATGDGDIMMRFSPAYHAVYEMERGATPMAATQSAIQKILTFYPNFDGAVLAANVTGGYGAACASYGSFPFTLANPITGVVIDDSVPC